MSHRAVVQPHYEAGFVALGSFARSPHAPIGPSRALDLRERIACAAYTCSWFLLTLGNTTPLPLSDHFSCYQPNSSAQQSGFLVKRDLRLPKAAIYNLVTSALRTNLHSSLPNMALLEQRRPSPLWGQSGRTHGPEHSSRFIGYGSQSSSHTPPPPVLRTHSLRGQHISRFSR